MAHPSAEEQVVKGPDPASVHALLDWFEQRQRDLPWRDAPPGERAPYRVWVSEIMLQQTRVEVVVDYFRNWMQRFPTVEALAEAAEDEVLQAWAGLGYYRRARFLQAGAKALVERGARGVRGPGWPQDSKAWNEIPGVGAYTAAALASFAGHEAIGVVDGNVKRVVARHAALALATDDRALHRASEEWMAVALATARPPGQWNEAVMELGATVCTPKAVRCVECPLKGSCTVYEAGAERASTEALHYPLPPKPKQWVELSLSCGLAVDAQGRVLLQQRTEGWNPGLWEPPSVITRASQSATASRSFATTAEQSLPGELGALLGEVKHTITHHKIVARVLELHPQPSDLESTENWAYVQPSSVGLTGLAKKILKRWV